jgi:hypothetical protein
MPGIDFAPITSGVFGWGLDISAGGDLEFLHGGATIDWSTVAALGADLTLADGTVYKTGEKVLLPGQVMLEETSGANIRMFGPYDPADVTTGRGTVAPFIRAGIVRRPVHYRPDISNRFYDSMIGLVIGGPVKRGLIRATAGTASLANGPTYANLAVLFPRLILVANLRGAHT